MRAGNSQTSEFFHKLAIGSSVVSAITTIIIAVAVPLIFLRANFERELVAQRSQQFKQDSNRVWATLHADQRDPSISHESSQVNPSIQYFTRKARSPWSKHVCSGCNMLSCQSGTPGLPGPPGEDGTPGDSGMPGKTGEDGYDVEVEPENDMPCVICPAGPPGQRGPQGERGHPGDSGTGGQGGPPGQPGVDGPPGNLGPSGNMGPKGDLGSAGPPGDTTIAGVGIKGPKGPPGPAGPKGPPGPAGKSSKEQGMPGKPGPSGPMGVTGLIGKPGEEGPWGPPGEPGQPSSYCPSDCGISHIVMPGMAAQGESESESQSQGGGGYGNDQDQPARPEGEGAAPAIHPDMVVPEMVTAKMGYRYR